MKERKENSEEEATRGGQDASETVVRGTRFQRVSSAWGPARPGHGSSSHKTRRDLSSFSSFVTSHLQQNRADEREKVREREIFPRRLDFTQNIRMRKEAWADSATDPPSSQWTLIIGEVPRRFPRFSLGSSSNDRDLPIVEFDVSICSFDFEGTAFTTWNVSIHKLRHRVSKSPGSSRVDSFLFFFFEIFSKKKIHRRCLKMFDL